ncbi:MAG: HAD family hydrolase [Candidatus Thorarchaeota archaeon]|nr:HAD family hydrolase [Candidatus Thorarchaeota archaeon]
MKFRLAVFDVDGTLTNHSSIWWRLHEHFGTEALGKVYYDQYFEGTISYKQWADFDAALWKGQPLQSVMEVVRNTELTMGAKEAIDTLKERGVQVAILSSGLDVMADDIAKRLGIDYVITNHLLHKDGILTGDVDVRVGWAEKADELERISQHFHTALNETAFIGDGRNDMAAFKIAGLSIAFNPKYDDVSEAADVTVREEDLRAILSLIL